jgi:gluconolactonase
MSLFAPPQAIESEVFVEVPAKYRKKTVNPERLAAGRPAVEVFLEGPSFDRDGNLYLVDIPHGRIFRASPRGDLALIAEYDGEPNGLKIHKDGRIFIADHKRGLMLLDPAKGEVTPLIARYHSEHFKGLNDLYFASNGDLYFTDQGQTGLQDWSGRLFRLNAAGQLDCLIDNIPSPNGVVLDPQEKHIYVAVTRMNCVWQLMLLPDATITRAGAYVYLQGGRGPDGMAMGAGGELVVAHPGMGSIWIFSKQGEPLYRVKSCRSDFITNIAFGGPDGKSLYITDSHQGFVLVAKTPVAGLPMYSHQ